MTAEGYVRLVLAGTSRGRVTRVVSPLQVVGLIPNFVVICFPFVGPGAAGHADRGERRF